MAGVSRLASVLSIGAPAWRSSAQLCSLSDRRRRRMNPVEQALRRVDGYQQQHAWLGVPFAVVKKFGDDNGGALVTLLAYNAFFALLPLLLLLVTLLGYLLGHRPGLQRRGVPPAPARVPLLRPP